MKIGTPSVDLITESDIYKKIEIAGRTCYKSEGNIKDEVECKCNKEGIYCLLCNDTKKTSSATVFVDKIIKNKHISVLEHGIVHVVLNLRNIEQDGLFSNRWHTILQGDVAVQLLAAQYAISFTIGDPVRNFENKAFLSGNVRRWKNALAESKSPYIQLIGHALTLHSPLLFCSNGVELKQIEANINSTNFDIDKYVKVYVGDVAPNYLEIKNNPNHNFKTVRIVHDRGLLNEYVRHRNLSPSQESTRYCNYFDSDIQFMQPIEIETGTPAFKIWLKACKQSEKSYKKLIELGVSTQNARSVLNLSLKSEIVFTGPLKWWQDVIDQRCTEAAHPDMKKVSAQQLCKALQMKPTNKYGKLYLPKG